MDFSGRKRSITRSEETEAKYQGSSAAVAHDGRVTAVQATPDGLHWLTAATDSRVRLWETDAFRRGSLAVSDHGSEIPFRML